MNNQLRPLVLRSLALQHKLKVLGSFQKAEGHEDIAQHLLAKWKLEDELRAVQETIDQLRRQEIDCSKQKLLGIKPQIGVA